MKIILFHISCILSFSLFSQNLIQNGDLEDTIPKSFGLKFPKYWDSPTDASPDYFSEYHNGIALNQFSVPMNFVGFQSPKSWKSYLGFSFISFNSPTVREYIQNELQERLKKDSVYCFQMYISLADSFSLATKNSIGVYFSDFKIDSNFFTRLNLNSEQSRLDMDVSNLIEGTYLIKVLTNGQLLDSKIFTIEH